MGKDSIERTKRDSYATYYYASLTIKALNDGFGGIDYWFQLHSAYATIRHSEETRYNRVDVGIPVQ